ncbi:malate synthase A [Micrococcales bacterium 31B]|nr:malate synthase A [Micrococcales bacterium 31B]
MRTLDHSLPTTRSAARDARLARPHLSHVEFIPGFEVVDDATLDSVPVHVGGALLPRFDEILTPAALAFVNQLIVEFCPRRAEILRGRRERVTAQRHGFSPSFRRDTRALRADATWRVAEPAPGLERRQVEIVTPATQRMLARAHRSGADVCIADFEDALSPTWQNIIEGQIHVRDAVRGRVRPEAAAGDLRGGARLSPERLAPPPTFMMRPRGWHLAEKHVTRNGHSVSASIVDFGLFMFHNAVYLVETGRGPYFYLPKLESAAEAKLWNDLFVRAQRMLGLPQGTIRATVLIETLSAACEMEEILYELREHSAGLNVGHWDYIFSVIKSAAHTEGGKVLPDREHLTLRAPFIRAASTLLIQTCHKRGAHAIGGPSSFAPVPGDPAALASARDATGREKRAEAKAGFDGAWVAHPDLVETARAEFVAEQGDAPNALGRPFAPVNISAENLTDLTTVTGRITVAGVAENVRACLEYLSGWLGGRGACVIDGRMEDAATVEISRMQLWQWIRRGAEAVDAEGASHRVSVDFVGRFMQGEAARLAEGADFFRRACISAAVEVLSESCLESEFPEYFTPTAYARYLYELAHATWQE